MPRGGRREGAGRKTQWESGCTFSETTVIRIPRILKVKILDMAHRLDAGDEINLVTKSISTRNQYLEDRIVELELALNESQKTIFELKEKQLESRSIHQFEIDYEAVSTKKRLEGFKQKILKAVGGPKSSKTRQRVEKALDGEIKGFLENK